MEERDVDAYLDSRKLNIDCKKAIEEAIALKFDGLHLEEDAATQVLEQFGEERMTFVMANTLRELSYDGRFSRQNKDWAEHIEIPENINQGKNLNQDYVIESHPAVLDGFIDMARAEIRMQKIEQALDEAEVTITADTRGFEADGHAGTWHTVMKESMQGRSFSSWNMMSMVQMWQGLSYRNMVSLLQKISGMGMMQEHWKLFQNICRRKGFL